MSEGEVNTHTCSSVGVEVLLALHQEDEAADLSRCCAEVGAWQVFDKLLKPDALPPVNQRAHLPHV